MDTGAFSAATTRWATASESLQSDQQDNELVPAQARHGAVRPHAVLQPPRDLHEHLVPGVVAQDVVDFLEIVQVQQQHVHRPGGQQRGGGAFVEEHPVGQARQRVLERQLLEFVRLFGEFLHGAAGLVLGALPRGDVAEIPDPAHDHVRDLLRPGVEFHAAAVLELQHVVALLPPVGLQLRDLLQEVVRIGQLPGDEGDQRRRVLRRDQLRRHAPQLEVLVVDPGDLAVVGDHHNPVGGGLQRGIEQRDRQPPARVGVLPVAAVPDGNRHGRAAVDRYQRARDLQRQFAAIPTPACRRERPPARRAAAPQPAKDPQEPAALVLGEQDGVPDAEQLLARIAKQPLGRRVHERDGSVRGQQQESIGALLEQAFFNPSSHGDTGPQSDGC